MSDEEAIRTVLSRYCFHVDANENEPWLALFTEDAVWSGTGLGTFKGKAALRKMREERAGQNRKVRHLTNNHVVTVKGSEANLKSYITLLAFASDGKVHVMGTGTYDIALVKRGSDWLIQNLSFERAGA